MKELMRVVGMNRETGEVRRFNLPTQWETQRDMLKNYNLVVPVEFVGSPDAAKHYVHEYLTDDKELTELEYVPINLLDLHEFLKTWQEFDKEQKQTVVALVENDRYDPYDALRAVRRGEAKITLLERPFLMESDDDRFVGRYYLDRLLECKFFGKVPAFFEFFFDTEGFGRCIRHTGGYGFWSDIYDRWVDLTPGIGNRCIWYEFVGK